MTRAGRRQNMDEPIEVVARDDRRESVANYLTSKGITPRSRWLDSFMRNAQSNVPIASLQQTAYFQILTSDITTSAEASAFPPQVVDPGTIERRLSGPILVQLVDIEDIGTSIWSQIEAIESQERGKTTRGREVIRVVPEERSMEGSSDQSTHIKSNGPHKLCFQDVQGAKVFAIEMSKIDKVDVRLPIGSKMLLRDLQIARGVLLLQPRGVQLLGGNISSWDTEWRSSRKQRLTDRIKPP